MAKKITTTENETETSPVANTEVLKDSALSIARTENGYSVIRIKYSLADNSVGEIEVIQTGMDRMAAQSLLKVQVAKEILMQ